MAKTKSRTRPRTGGSMIDVLQAELAERRQRVTQLEEAHARVVEKGEAAVAEARRQVDDYVAKIAEALGLPNPVAREAKRMETLRLRKQVWDLHKAGKQSEEIAAELGVELAAVEPVVAKLRERMAKSGQYGRNGSEKGGENGGDDEDTGAGGSAPLRQPPGAGQKGYKRNRVRELYLEGRTRGEIADELDISKECVNSHLGALRRQGLIESDGAEPPAGGAQPAGSTQEGDDDGGDDGDSVQDLREEVARQQGGNRNQPARLPTTEVAEHEHVALVDRMGDGETVPDEGGHRHKVYRFVVGGSRGEGTEVHRHGLLAKEPGA